MQKHKIFMVGGSPGYACWFPFPYNITHDAHEATVAWWIGGCDVDPALYGEKQGSHTYACREESQYEAEMWDFFKDRDVLKIGTCKGHQNLAVLNFKTAKLVQHSRHPWKHIVKTFDGLDIESNSLHHQQIILDEKITGLKDGVDYNLIGWTEKLSPFHLDGNDNDYNFASDYKEPEIVWVEKTKCFMVQSHPEMMDRRTSFVKYCRDFVANKIKQ